MKMLNLKTFYLLIILINIYNVYMIFDQYIIFELSNSDSGVEMMNEIVINPAPATVEEELPTPPIVPVNKYNVFKAHLKKEIHNIKYKIKENIKFFKYSPSQFIEIKIEEAKVSNSRFSLWKIYDKFRKNN
uniref:Uncharacterized protein n=1 Tax=Clonostachys rogersoniana TaxID=122658 RepID=A0A8F2BR61_CLORO|nr:hypothetical protein [Clonostachys rogersoniana]